MLSAALTFLVVGRARAQAPWPTPSLAPATTEASLHDIELPDAPGWRSAVQGGGQSKVVHRSSGVEGVVVDSEGNPVAGAQVTLSGVGGVEDRLRVTDPKGAFNFADLPDGSYRVTIVAQGLKSFYSDEILLAPGEGRDMGSVGLPVSSTTSDITVTASPDEVAQAQVHEAEKQRVLGILPNFYSTYVWNAAPMTAKLKYNLALHSVLDPVAVLTSAGVAGVEQLHNTFPGYGRGPTGYLERFGASNADHVMGRMISSAVLPALFHQDPRYFYKGSGTVMSRAWYSIESAFVCRGDNGKLQPNYSHVLGNFAAAGLSNLYRAPEDRNASLTMRNGMIITAGNMVSNLLREFLLRGMSTHVPKYDKGKP